MAERAVFGAVDIGASSGRVIAGIVTDEGIELVEVHRFGNATVEVDGSLHWDIDSIMTEVVTGLRRLVECYPDVISVGVDTWAVDYGLLDADGTLLGDPYAYRDPRTEAVVDAVHARVDVEALYTVAGLQFLPFNTIYQLVAEQNGPRWAVAATLLLIPDLIVQRLTGVRIAEITNASTTGLLDARTRAWSTVVLAALDIPADLLPELVEPGTVVGPVRADLGLPDSMVVTTVGSHDTASAVVGVPATTADWAYVSSGTWSLVGVELDQPVLTDASREANFTNEGGVDGTVRYLRNVGGLWLLEQCREVWRTDGDLETLLAAAAELPAGGPVIDVDSSELIAPGDMPARIAAAIQRTGAEPSDDPAMMTRCILDSLASAYALTLRRAAELSGRPVEVVHVVGGGAQNRLLCQLTADATGLEVVAGPVEGTALGNVLVQARAHGVLSGDLPALRRRLADSVELIRYAPSAESAQSAQSAQPPTG